MNIKNKIYIANIIEEGSLGGPQTRIINVTKFIDNDFDITIILPKDSSEYFTSKLNKNKIKYKKLFITTLSKKLDKLFQYLFYFFYEVYIIAKYLKKNNFDLIHISGGAWQFKSVLSSYIAGIKIIWHLNDAKMPKIIRLIFLLFSFMPSAFICSSERTKEYYKKYMLKKNTPIFILYAPVNFKYINYKNTLKNDIKEKNKIKLITVANISPIKGLELIIEIAKKLNQNKILYQFDIYGNVSDKQNKYYHRLFYKSKGLNINFLKFDKNIINRYFEYDVYICTSFSESSPTSIWEAMITGRLIISTDVGDLKNIFESMNYNFIISRNVDEIYQKIIYIKNNYNQLIKNVYKNQNYVRDNHNPISISKLNQIIYSKVLNNE